MSKSSLDPSPPLRPTLSDVARIAKVSTMAASSVLNGARSTARVAENTRQRIIAASTLLGYQPNVLSRALVARRTNIIGLYTGAGTLTADVPFSAKILAGLQKGCAEHGKDLMLQGRFAPTNRWGITYPDLTDGRLDGAIVLANQGDPLLDRLTGGAMPVVAMVNAIREIPSVLSDETMGAELLVRHLAARGHRRILWRTSQQVLDDSTRRRHEGLQAACGRAAMHLIAGDGGQDPRPFTLRERALIAKEAPDRVTAVICFADYVCEALVDDALRLGLVVPDDLAIAGFDGITLVHQQRPLHALTTIRCRWDDVAWKSVEVLTQRLSGRSPPLETIIPVELVCGSTT